MNKTKVYIGRDLIGRFTCDGKQYTRIGYQLHLAKRMAQKSLIASFILVVGAWLVTAGIYIAKATIEPNTLYAKEIVEVPIIEIPPVLERIAQCESGNTHYRHGQVIMNANTNKTVDIGKYQINSIHSKEATRLGFDLTTEDGNEGYALYLYHNFGTEPWYSSIKCWNK